MKKRIILFLIAILLLPIASAEIVLDSLDSSTYNKGEKLSVSGTILRDTAVEGGSLDFQLVCGDLEFNLPPLTITIREKVAKSFSTESFTIPSAAEENCYVKVSLLFDDALLETKNTEQFIVSDELKAGEEDFQVNPIQVQLGKTLTIYGYITNINDEPITGSATINFRSQDKTYYVDNVDVAQGKLEYSYTATDNKPGEYFVDVLVNDVYGNKKLFEGVAKFNIVDEVHIFIEPIYKKISPGSTVQILGEVNTILGEPITKGTMQIILEDEIFSAEIKDGKLSYDLILPETIKTGKHTLSFSFIDQATGNWGSTDKTLNVEAIPTEIKLNTFQESVMPEQLMNVIVFLYDQANDGIIEDVTVELIDSKDKTIFLDSVESGEKFSIDIPQYSVPGTWKLKSSYANLQTEMEVTVEEYPNVEVELVNETVYIKNTGNVEYNDPVSVNLNDGDFVLTKKFSIEPGETVTVDLTKEAPSGQYDISITGNAVAANQFDNTIIVGKNKRSLNFIYSFLMIVFIASLAYLSIFKKRQFENIKVRTQRDMNSAKLRLKKIKAMKERQGMKRHTFSKEQSITDFKERILRDIRETEEKIESRQTNPTTEKTSSEEKKDDDLPSGMFNMFS